MTTNATTETEQVPCRKCLNPQSFVAHFDTQGGLLRAGYEWRGFHGYEPVVDGCSFVYPGEGGRCWWPKAKHASRTRASHPYQAPASSTVSVKVPSTCACGEPAMKVVSPPKSLPRAVCDGHAKGYEMVV